MLSYLSMCIIFKYVPLNGDDIIILCILNNMVSGRWVTDRLLVVEWNEYNAII